MCAYFRVCLVSLCTDCLSICVYLSACICGRLFRYVNLSPLVSLCVCVCVCVCVCLSLVCVCVCVCVCARARIMMARTTSPFHRHASVYFNDKTMEKNEE